MQRINIRQLKPGMVISRNLFTGDGELLISAGTELTGDHIERLANLNFVSVYASDNRTGCHQWEFSADVISEETRLLTIRQVRQAFVMASATNAVDLSKTGRAVQNILDEIMTNDSLLYSLVDIRNYQDYLFGHSVNVCVLSLMMGITMGYNSGRLKELGIGALLHDLGHCSTPAGLLDKTEILSPEEVQAVRRHAGSGFDILRKQNDLSLLSAHVALQHHERWDGNGYPRRLAKKDIHEYARIVATADVFDALQSDRPYRAAYSLKQSVQIMRGLAGTHLDPHCVEALLANVAVYPAGSLVELSNGSLAVVMASSRDCPARPVVKVIYDAGRKATRNKHAVDLRNYSTVFIRRTVSEEEMQKMVAGC